MNGEAGWKAFVYWIVAGMGLHIGWGLIALIIYFAAKALNQAGPVAIQ